MKGSRHKDGAFEFLMKVKAIHTRKRRRLICWLIGIFLVGWIALVFCLVMVAI